MTKAIFRAGQARTDMRDSANTTIQPFVNEFSVDVAPGHAVGSAGAMNGDQTHVCDGKIKNDHHADGLIETKMSGGPHLYVVSAEKNSVERLATRRDNSTGTRHGITVTDQNAAQMESQTNNRKGLLGMGSDGHRELEALQAKFLTVLVREYGQTSFEAYFSGMTLADVSGDLVSFETPSESRRDMIGRNQLMTLKRLWHDHMGPVSRVTIKLCADVSRSLSDSSSRAFAKAIVPSNQSKPTPSNHPNGREGKRPFFKDISGQFSTNSADRANLDRVTSSGSASASGSALSINDILSPVDERNSFDAFAVDASNELAYAAARSTLNDSGGPELIYLYGKSGVGKTHLLHAIALESKKRNPNGRVVYLTYTNIASGCVNAMLQNNTAQLHNEFLDCDIVLIDDIHLLLSKKKTQMQMMAILDACVANGCHAALAGDVGPVQLAASGMDQRLSDRLSGGFSVGLQSGGPHLRFDVLKKRLARSDVHCTMNEDALDFIVRNFNHSMRETIGALNQLLLVYGKKEVRVDLAQARDGLRDKLRDCSRVHSLEDLLEVSAEVMGVSVADMRGKARPQELARARHAFVYCAREVLKESLPRISAALNRDHTTALSSVRRAAALLERDKVFCKQVDLIREKIEG